MPSPRTSDAAEAQHSRLGAKASPSDVPPSFQPCAPPPPQTRRPSHVRRPRPGPPRRCAHCGTIAPSLLPCPHDCGLSAAVYCTLRCQTADYESRHKHVCVPRKKPAKSREQILKEQQEQWRLEEEERRRKAEEKERMMKMCGRCGNANCIWAQLMREEDALQVMEEGAFKYLPVFAPPRGREEGGVADGGKVVDAA